LTPTATNALVTLSISARTFFSNCAGVLTFGHHPRTFRRSLICADETMRYISAATCSTMGRGTPAGMNIPYH
jgi:hypothetical protein